ncbi:hypothetical protein MJH12_11770, partial [bacterium]|nr:hypothetical protein [bacterium]
MRKLILFFIFISNYLFSDTIQLSKGWNFVALPISRTVAVPTFLATQDINADNIVGIWSFDQTMDKGRGAWKSYPKLAGFLELVELHANSGYWIQIHQDLSFFGNGLSQSYKDFSLDKSSGIHLIGFGTAHADLTSPDQFFLSDPLLAKPQIVWSWDKSNRSWLIWSPSSIIQSEISSKYALLTHLTPGEAYFVNMLDFTRPKDPFVQGAKGERGPLGPIGPPGEQGPPVTIKDLSIDQFKLADLSISFQKLQDGVASGSKLGPDVVTIHQDQNITGLKTFSKLSIKSSDISSNSFALNILNAENQSLFTVKENGNTGIGVKEPKQKLHVDGSILAKEFLGDGSKLSGIIFEESDPTVNDLAKTNLICETQQIIKWNGNQWICTSDLNTQLNETQVDLFVANNSFIKTYIETDPTVNDLAKTSLFCENNQVVKWVENSWLCRDDLNQILSETQVDAMVSNNGYLSNFFEVDPTVNILAKTVLNCQINQIVKWNGSKWFCVTNVDQDTHLSESQVDLFVSNNAYITTSSEIDPTVNTLAKSPLNCTTHQIVKWFENSWKCKEDVNTQLTENQVDSMVSNNGYLSDFSETDPTVNSLAKSNLNCQSNQIIKWDGSYWICAHDLDSDTHLTEAQVDSYVANNSFLTSYTETDPTVNH